jgi:transposase-like protein
MKYTINQFRKDYPNDDVCLDVIFRSQYAKHPACPCCGQEAEFKRIPTRRCYQCSDKDCQYQWYPTKNTVFESTRTSLVDWFYVIYLMTSTRNGVSAKEIQRQLGVTYKCAWRMGHQIRLLMAQGGLANMLSGTVEVDETYIGGKSLNKHKKQREAMNMNAKGINNPNKIAVMAMLERNGNIITKVIPDASGAVLKPIIAYNIVKGTIIVTDGHRGYKGLEVAYNHNVVNHEQDEFVVGTMHTNTVEGYFSHLKRTIKGTHIYVSRKHLQKYADECSFRYVHRNEGQLMFKTILGRIVA